MFSAGYVKPAATNSWHGTPFPASKRCRATERKPPRDPLRLACYYQSLLDSGMFESRAALARYLGVSQARVTQLLNRLESDSSTRTVSPVCQTETPARHPSPESGTPGDQSLRVSRAKLRPGWQPFDSFICHASSRFIFYLAILFRSVGDDCRLGRRRTALLRDQLREFQRRQQGASTTASWLCFPLKYRTGR